MYESPIKIIESTIDSFSKAIIKQRDDAIFAEIQSSFSVDLDRAELIRALQYDRNQYEKGYADGKADAMAELVHCCDCQNCTVLIRQVDSEPLHFCELWRGHPMVDPTIMDKESITPTNADRIRAMSDEELAEFIRDVSYECRDASWGCHCQTCSYPWCSSERTMEWLKQPAEE